MSVTPILAGLIPIGLVLVVLVACAPATSDAGERPRAADAPLDDGQIAEIVEVFDVEQIRTAQLASPRASDPAVHAFADELLADHQREQEAERALLARSHIELQTSILTQGFDAEARAARSWMSNQAGATFDRDLLAGEIKELSRQLDRLDHMLIPGVRDAGLRVELQHRRAMDAGLLDEAKRLAVRFPPPP